MELEPHLDRAFDGLARGGETRERLGRLLEADDGLAEGRTLRGRGSSLAKARRRPLPRLALAVVTTEGEGMRLEVARIHGLDGFGHTAVEKPAAGRQQSGVCDLADAVVGEVEALAHAVQHAAAHEFLRPLGRLRLAEIDRALEEGKVEFPPDHRRHRHQGPGPLREPLESSRDRKSTRLNSSHTVISYAVFCLKKKKK